MDEISVESVQTLGSPPSEAVLDCLSNSVVVRKVLEHFNDRQLLELSFVSTLWSYEARCLIKKRGSLTAYLKSDSTHPWEQVLEAFGTDLQKMSAVPYSGITIVINSRCRTVRSKALDATPDAALARFALKRLSVSLYADWWMHKYSPALLLVKKLFQYFSAVPEEIELYIGGKQQEFVEHFVGECNFPGLKVLKLKDSHSRASAKSYTNYVKALISRAKSLRELHTNGPIYLKSNVLEGSEAVRVHGSKVKAHFGDISESIINTLRLELMEMNYTGSGFNFERFNRITPILLQVSCATTLQCIEFDAVLAIPLMCYGIPLINVEDPWININYNQMQQVELEISSIVKNFDFTRILPNVKRVTVTSYFDDFEHSSDHLDTILEQADAVLGDATPDRAAQVKELCLVEADISDAAVSFFAEMFPNIERLEIGADDDEEIPFGTIWKHWIDLGDIEVSGTMIQNSGNLDSVFCGIFPEELAELRLKDEDFLKTVHIVPVLPAITCLKNLEALNIYHDKRTVEPYADDGTFMFSKVAGLIAFARCPSLAVISLKFRSDAVIPETSHLEAFASVSMW